MGANRGKGGVPEVGCSKHDQRSVQTRLQKTGNKVICLFLFQEETL